MVTKDDVEKQRTPRGLRQFVARRVKKIKQIKDERHKAMQKEGIYKFFLQEVIPLSIFCLKQYSNNHSIQPVIGNQGYDAVVRNERGRVIDYIEVTLPHDGASRNKNVRLVVSRGYSETGVQDIDDIGEDLTRMFPSVLKTCKDKSRIDYSDCTLVVVVEFIQPDPENEKLYTDRLKQLIDRIRDISFRAKRVYVLAVPFKRVFTVFD